MITIYSKKFFQNIVGDGQAWPHVFREKVFLPILLSFISVSMQVSTGLNSFIDPSVNTISAVTSFMVSLSMISWISIYWHFLINRRRIYSLMDDMSNLINERMRMNFTIYDETDREIKFYLNLFWKGIVMPIRFLYVTPFIVVIYHSCVGKYSVDSWITLMPVWLPFELDSALTFFVTNLWLAMNTWYMMGVIHLTLSIFMEMSLFAKPLLIDIRLILDHMDRSTKVKNSDDLIREQCLSVIILHERINQCMIRFADVMNATIIFAVGPTTICLSTCLLVLQKNMANAALYESQMPIAATILFAIFLLSLFSIGQKLHSDLLGLCDMIYGTEWHLYSADVRRILLLMMMRAQRRFYLSAYGIMPLTLENFVRVLRSLYSAFMLLQNIN